MVEPMYRQIADSLRRQIETGGLESGQRLPTELELREQFNASRNTIRDAIRRLTVIGLVETRPGFGTVVARKVDPFVTVLTYDPATSGSEEASPPARVSVVPGNQDKGPILVELQLRLKVPAQDRSVSLSEVLHCRFLAELCVRDAEDDLPRFRASLIDYWRAVLRHLIESRERESVREVLALSQPVAATYLVPCLRMPCGARARAGSAC